MDKIKETLETLKDWAVSRWYERTTWDGAVLIAVGLIVLLFAPLIKISFSHSLLNSDFPDLSN